MRTRTTLALALLLACDPEPRAAPTVEPRAAAAEARPALLALQPITTRAGHPRFTDPMVKDPLAAEVFGERLAGAEAPAVRLALAEALPRCGGDWSAVSVARLAVEADAAVRAVLVAGLQRAKGEPALIAARRGIQDPSPDVRRAAAELAGWVPEVGEAVTAELRAALADSSAEVRAAATRSLGLVGGAGTFEAIAPGLADSEPKVRLESLRALRRIDEARARQLPATLALRQDPDERVRRAAQ